MAYVFGFKQCFINAHFFCLLAVAVMKNTGVLFANDINVDRIRAVVGNFHRLGVVNSVVSSCDGRKLSLVCL
jgi:16S rRNA C967 or C1407 C5-methylase (RsmB/RsmF family)